MDKEPYRYDESDGRRAAIGAEPPPDKSGTDLFVAAWARYNRPDRIVTLGDYYSRTQISSAMQVLREQRAGYGVTSPGDQLSPDQHLVWTRLVRALADGRQWPIKRLFAMLDPMLEDGVALAAAPTHLAYQAFWPMRTLARKLAEGHGRIDATACLVRHTTVERITFGGRSTVALHRQSIRVERPELLVGRPVLLLDDVARSGSTLAACRALLYGAGAATVQALAVAQVIGG